jgi:hypothetical protein
MKRMIMAVLLLVSTVSVFAADVKSEGKKDQVKTEIKMSGKELGECSISVEATLSTPIFEAKVTCKGTAATCKEAVSIAKNCLDEARKALQ